MPNYDYHDTITIRETLLSYNYYQGLKSQCIMILSAFPNQMKFVDFIKPGLPVKIQNITTLSNISFAIILTNIFAKQKSSLLSHFVNFDKKNFRMVL